ncbi:hypothetical protein [Humisphaera borealis]|uniref:Thioesterase domain-containing protein n=1 Tax=Humisphaera borealis TaxID=2807512 RepID=A0A7M2WQM6_9BACT|nr:hypothetical protein [Humisphaera borealis]QOV87544.1 hypothetical protein IPV69_14730 [Humisphaera borealis]
MTDLSTDALFAPAARQRYALRLGVGVPAIALLVGLLNGCNAAPAGDPSTLAAITAPTTSPASRSAIVLIRGWRDLYSDGIDQLASKLRQAGRPAVVFKEDQWRQVESALAERAAAKSLASPVILVGFSYGADDVILISRRLNEIGQSVDLLIVIDPVTPAEIPPNVVSCLNFYQSNGVWDAFPWLRGVPVKDEPARLTRHPPTTNIDIRTRPELLEPGTSHSTIAANAKVHAAIVDAVKRLPVETQN